MTIYLQIMNNLVSRLTPNVCCSFGHKFWSKPLVVKVKNEPNFKKNVQHIGLLEEKRKCLFI